MSDENQHLDLLTDGLLRIEIELRQLGVWQAEPPPQEAFQSTQPFCLDTMEFPQWLQFVFLERMKVLVEHNHPLSSASGIAPMEIGRASCREREYSPLSIVSAG